MSIYSEVKQKYKNKINEIEEKRKNKIEESKKYLRNRLVPKIQKIIKKKIEKGKITIYTDSNPCFICDVEIRFTKFTKKECELLKWLYYYETKSNRFQGLDIIKRAFVDLYKEDYPDTYKFKVEIAISNTGFFDKIKSYFILRFID